MHIKVQQILAQDVGYRQTFTITGERPDFDGLALAADLNGDITIGRLDDGLLVSGYITTELDLVCDRCLRSFTRPVRISFERIFRDKPVDDDLPVEHDTIDLAPLVWQELQVVQPIKQLCRPDCPGIDSPKTDLTDSTSSGRLGDRARITKG